MAAPANFGELKALIGRDLGEDQNNDLSDEIDKAVLAAIDFYSENAIWFLEHQFESQFLADTVAYDLPVDLDAIDQATVDLPVTWPLLCIPFERYRALRVGASGAIKAAPQFYALYRDDLFPFPVPDMTYDYRLFYRRRLPELTVSTSTNAWITHGWRLLRSHAEWDIATHRLHSPPVAPERYWQAAQIELAKLEQRSRGRGKHREPAPMPQPRAA